MNSNTDRMLTGLGVALLAATTFAADPLPEVTTSEFRDGERVVFWGDSITQQARWIRFLADFYLTHHPERHLTFRNAGIAGNSFGGGIKQIARDVVPWKPTTVFTMFGMNDAFAAGPYHPGWPSTDAEREKLRVRIERGYRIDADNALKVLKEQCGEKLRIVMMTPSIYDSTTRAPKDKPVNYGWNITLGESAKKLIDGYRAGKWELVELWGPMTAYNEQMQAKDPKFSIVSAQERVHPDDNGGWFMARQILKAQGADPLVSDIVFDAAKGRVRTARRARVTEIARMLTKGWKMKVLEEALPLPKAAAEAPELNLERFAAKGLGKGDWELKIDGVTVWRGSAAELAAGIELGTNTATPQMEQAKQVVEKNRLRHEKESRLRALASLRWWLPMDKKVKDPDDIAEVRAWLEANPKHGGLFGGGRMLKEYLAEWPEREATYAEIAAMDAEIDRLRAPVARVWTLEKAR